MSERVHLLWLCATLFIVLKTLLITMTLFIESFHLVLLNAESSGKGQHAQGAP